MQPGSSSSGKRLARNELARRLDLPNRVVQQVEVFLAIISLDGVTEKDPLLLPHHRYLDPVALEQMPLQRFRRLRPDRNAAHLAQEFIAYRADRARLEQLAEPEIVIR